MDDPKAVLARLPAAVLKHPVKLKDLRTQWDQGCSKILLDAHLSSENKIKVVMDWLAKAGVRDFVLGKLVLSFSRPLPIPPTEEQRKERRQKTFTKMVYTDDIPHLRAVNKVVTNRLETVPPGTIQGSFATLDALEDSEQKNPGSMFSEFARSIEELTALEYRSGQPERSGDSAFSSFEHAAE